MMLFLAGRNIIFSLSSAFSGEFLFVYDQKEKSTSAATAMVLLSLSFFLSFIQTTLLYNKTDFSVIENYYPYTERERERKESVVRSLLCVCVIEMWDDRDKKEIQKSM